MKQAIEKIQKIINIRQQVIDLWSDFDFAAQVAEVKSSIRLGGMDVNSMLYATAKLIKNLIKFPFSAVLLLEQHIEIAAIIYAAISLTSGMPLAIAILSSILLAAAGSYILVLNGSSNILHGFMPAFLKNKTLTSDEDKSKYLANLSMRDTAIKIAYLVLRLILVAVSFKLLIVQLHKLNFVSQLLANIDKIIPALKLTGVYLAALCSGLALAELYAKISNSVSSSKESNAMLLAIASLMSILFAVPLSIYASVAFTGIILPLAIVNVGIMRSCFVAAWHLAPEEPLKIADPVVLAQFIGEPVSCHGDAPDANNDGGSGNGFNVHGYDDYFEVPV